MSEKLTQETIGKLLDGERERDAIHIAVVPVVASEKLWPGQSVGLIEGSQVYVKGAERGIGIVDPFLSGPVFPDQRCWLFITPNTVTGMRHRWEHPAFDARQESDAGESWRWMENLAANSFAPYEGDRNYSAEELIEAGREYLRSGERMVQQGSESLRDDTDRREYWRHFQNITGIIVPAHELDCAPFCCTC